MKIKSFLVFIRNTLLHRTELDFPTVSYILRAFYDNMSDAEKEREGKNLELLLKTTTQQITLNQSLTRAKTKNLSAELMKLKNEVKRKR